MAQRGTKFTFSTEDLLSVPQAAKELGVHFATVYRWIERELLHPVRIANQIFLTIADVKALREQREREGVVYVVHRPIRKRNELLVKEQRASE